MLIQPIIDIAEVFSKKGITDIVVSPGSRSAHLTIAFARHKKIKTHVINDERSAAYIALGIAQSQNRTVGLICTSGTASLNYAPGIAEAYYQRVPLIILTADRPADKLNTLEGQMIDQNNIYQNYAKGNFTFTGDLQTINNGINLANELPQGPVHINTPINEPFYPTTEEVVKYNTSTNTRDTSPKKPNLSSELINNIRAEWEEDNKKIIIIGQGQLSKKSTDLINKQKHTTVITEPTSSSYKLDYCIKTSDYLCKENNPDLSPNILVTFGGSLISKRLKNFIKNNRPKEHWHVQQGGKSPDQFNCLTKHIDCSPEYFLSILPFSGINNFAEKWNKNDQKSREKIDRFIDKQKTGEFKAVHTIIKQTPKDATLHISNSMPIRYANILGHKIKNNVYSNRGVSGIDGCTSTCVGHALNQENLQVLITGDMAFQYDINALWNNNLPANVRIIILNNYGGGIFRKIPGPDVQPELENYFVSKHNNTFEYLNSFKGLEYKQCDTINDLTHLFESFYQKSDKAKVIEYISDDIENTKIYKKLFK